MPNRNVESHFAYNPTNIDISRSTFDMSRSVKTTFNVGELVPLCPPMEVLPGDTFQVDTSRVVRLQTLLTPMMDNLYMDTYWFFVPNRLVWTHWKQFMGENTESAWLPSTEYSVPQLKSPDGGWDVGTIADYFGIPTGVDGIYVNAMPFRGYATICNEWFRSEVVSDPLVVWHTDTLTQGNNGSGLENVQRGGKPYLAAKYFDYFTGCLPSPQKGPDVQIPLVEGSSNQGWVPVRSFPSEHLSNPSSGDSYLRGYSFVSGGTNSHIGITKSTSGTTMQGQAIQPDGTLTSGYPFIPSNLWANVQGFATTINDLRLAFQVQKLYEKDARGGTRYIEVLKSHFGVTSPDSRLQRPEYLGGNRIPISINQVIQQSADSGSNYLGDVGAQSLTVDNHSDFTHSFTEHGFLFCLGVVRYDHTYQQGLARFWSRKNRFDYYWPVFANIGEQPVFRKEIYCTGSASNDDHVFGYQEAWADYRYQPNIVTGEMRSQYAQSLDSWHLADNYSSAPVLSDAWIREDKNNVDRVLAVTSSNSNQVFGDFYFKVKATRAMPVYSIPGLIDHH